MEICPSCATVHPIDYQCPCIIDRSEALAALVHEVRRHAAAGWRRPRAWERLPHGVRQSLTGQAQDVVECLEGAGWRFVSTAVAGRHALRLDATGTQPAVQSTAQDDDPATDPFRVRNVVR